MANSPLEDSRIGLQWMNLSVDKSALFFYSLILEPQAALLPNYCTMAVYKWKVIWVSPDYIYSEHSNIIFGWFTDMNLVQEFALWNEKSADDSQQTFIAPSNLIKYTNKVDCIGSKSGIFPFRGIWHHLDWIDCVEITHHSLSIKTVCSLDRNVFFKQNKRNCLLLRHFDVITVIF